MRRQDCVKRDLERVGGEWRTTAKDRRSWRLVIQNTVREKRSEEIKGEDKMTVTVASLTPDDRDNKRGTTPSLHPLFILLPLLTPHDYKHITLCCSTAHT